MVISNQKILYIFTTFFPYENHEIFLEAEIEVLSKKYDKIYLIPSNKSGKQTRKLPNNCSVLGLEKINPKKHAFKLLFKKYFWDEILVILKISLSNSFQRIIKAFMWLGYGNELANKLEIHIGQNMGNEITVYSYWMNEFALGATQLKEKFNNIKAISRAHGFDLYPDRNKLNYLPYRKYISHRLDAIFFISKHGQSYLGERFPSYKNKFELSYLGTTFSGKLNQLNNVNKLKIVSCSSLNEVKRIHLIVEALALVFDFSIHWVHFGDGNLFEEIKNKCVNLLDKKENISYELKGFVANRDVKKYYEENPLDFLMNVSSSEGLPVSMMEAFSYAIPVIGTNVGGVSEIIDSNINGFLLSSNPSPKEIKDYLEKYSALSDRQKKSFKTKAREKWENNFNAEKNYPAFANDVHALHKKHAK